MPNVMYKEEKLSNLFDCISGNSKYTKKYCNAHAGEYEVYTGSTLQKFASLSTYDYDKPHLTFTTDGEYAGTLKVLTGKYNVGGHRKLLIKKHENLDLDYFSIILQTKFYEKVKKGDVPSVNWNNKLSNIIVKIPINQNGDYDIEKQKEIAFKYKEIKDKKNLLLQKIEHLKKIKIDILQNSYNYVEVPITKLFKPKGGCMKLSKEYCKTHKGSFPVYSGSKQFETFGNIKSYDYDGEYLTWIIDGLAGYIMHIDGKFSITCHRGILIPTTKCKNVDLHYIKYMIEPIFRERKRGRIGINGKNEYTALKPSHINSYNDIVKIPIKDDGSFDLDKQKEIAQKYATIESIKEDLYNRVMELTNIVVV